MLPVRFVAAVSSSNPVFAMARLCYWFLVKGCAGPHGFKGWSSTADEGPSEILRPVRQRISDSHPGPPTTSAAQTAVPPQMSPAQTRSTPSTPAAARRTGSKLYPVKVLVVSSYMLYKRWPFNVNLLQHHIS